jgi:hypothetical protein
MSRHAFITFRSGSRTDDDDTPSGVKGSVLNTLSGPSSSGCKRGSITGLGHAQYIPRLVQWRHLGRTPSHFVFLLRLSRNDGMVSNEAQNDDVFRGDVGGCVTVCHSPGHACLWSPATPMQAALVHCNTRSTWQANETSCYAASDEKSATSGGEVSRARFDSTCPDE